MIYFDYLTANYAEIRSNLNAYPQSMILIEKVCTNYLQSDIIISLIRKVPILK